MAYVFDSWQNSDENGAWGYWVELDENGQPLSHGKRCYIPTEQQLSVGNIPPANAEYWASSGC